ncbi:hypothetical protein PG997_011641 [Apiospora hydei]|uniref:SH3 domain-containing protein n=1 Tax=Apiospora hydei TaxID=1337664 RepID=A0ABR1VJN7_9PEZI
MSLSTFGAESISIYEAATKCREAFLPCLVFANLMNLEWAENRLADFNLWANGVGAFTGNRASLDERLSRDPDTRGIIVHVLGLLHGCIQQCQNLAESSTSGSPAPASSGDQTGAFSSPTTLYRSFSPFSDISSDSEPTARLNDDADGSTALAAAMRDVEQLINQLARLSVAIRSAGTASRFRKADKLYNPDDYSDLRTYLENIIKARPPGLNGGNLIISKSEITPSQNRLVEANLRRRNRFVYAMRHARKLAMAAPELPEKTSLVLEPPGTNISNTVPVSIPKMEIPDVGNMAPAFTETNASSLGTLPPVLPAKAPPSRATMTQITSTAAKVAYPKPPRVKMGLHQFKCPCCCQTLPLLYQERTQWNTPGTVPRLFTTVDGLTEHIRASHSDAVSEEHIAAAISAALRPAPFGISRCPLCDATGTSDSDVLFDHIAEHVHSFSLQSLPWPDDVHCGEYFLQNGYFDDNSDNASQQYNVSSFSDRDSEGLPSLGDMSDTAVTTLQISEEEAFPAGGGLDTGTDMEPGTEPDTELQDDVVFQARTLYDYEATEEGELSFRKGDMLSITKAAYRDWWEAIDSEKHTGIVPDNYLEKIYHLSAESVHADIMRDIELYGSNKNAEHLLNLVGLSEYTDEMLDEMRTTYRSFKDLEPKLLKARGQCEGRHRLWQSLLQKCDRAAEEYKASQAQKPGTDVAASSQLTS